jgi:glycosyltransferase involved in cell wall biosynthesis
VASVGFLFAHGRVRRILIAQIAHSVVAVGLAFAFLPSLGVIALGVAMCGGAVTDAAVLGSATLKGAATSYLRAIGPLVVGTVSLGGASFALAQRVDPGWQPLVVAALATLAGYALLLLALAREDTRRLVRLFRVDVLATRSDSVSATAVLEHGELVERLRNASVLSTFAPAADGIARYADQLVDALRRNGATVRRIGLAHFGSGGDLIVDPTGGARFLRVTRRVPRSQTLLVMWHTHYLTPGRQLARIAAITSMAIGFRVRRTIVLQHEPDDDLVTGIRGPRRVARSVEQGLRRVMWAGAAEIWFHSAYERDAFRRRYPRVAAKATLCLVTHGKDFTPEVTISKAEARHVLGVPADERMFLCLGFLSVHKGVDRVLRAFSAAAPSNARLWIVGNAMRPDEETRQHIETLRAMAAQIENVEISVRFVDNKEFDTWLRATDFAVLAYRSAASSSVIPRAQLLGARVIGSGVGGTAEQLRAGVDIVASDELALTRTIREVSDHER